MCRKSLISEQSDLISAVFPISPFGTPTPSMSEVGAIPTYCLSDIDKSLPYGNILFSRTIKATSVSSEQFWNIVWGKVLSKLIEVRFSNVILN